MFPGLTTKISESKVALGAAIYPKTDLIFITDTAVTTNCTTIVSAFGGGFPGVLFVVNKSGAPFRFDTGGNIGFVWDVNTDSGITLCYSKIYSQWYPIG